MAGFVEIITTINRIPAELAGEMLERMAASPEDVEKDVLAGARPIRSRDIQRGRNG